MFARYLAVKEMPQNTSISHLTEPQYVEFRAFCEADDNIPDLGGIQDDTNLVQSHGDTQEGFHYADDQNDGDYDPIHGDVSLIPEVDDLGDGDVDPSDPSSFSAKKRSTRSYSSFTAEWKSSLHNADSRDVFSPRVMSIAHTLREIATDYPGEGMVVMSASLLFLDVVGEALARKASEDGIFHFPVKEYNGTQAVRDRTRIIRALNDSTGTRVLLATTGVGGVGVNMHGASHLVLATPF